MKTRERSSLARPPAHGRTGPGARWGAIVAIAIVALVAFLAPRSEPARKTESVSPARDAYLERGPSGGGPVAPRSAFRAPPAGAQSDSAPSDPYDARQVPPPRPSSRWPYPPGSQPLVEGVDPATQMKEDDTVDAKSGVSCIFGPRVAVVHPPDPLVIDLEVVSRLGAALPIERGVARFRAGRTHPDDGPWWTVPFVDDGSGRDVAASDLRYTATFAPDPAQQAALLDGGIHVFVDVGFDGPDGLGSRRYATTMEYARRPGAALDGKYTESIEDGSLVVAVGVSASTPGEYRVVASLYGGGRAIAFAQKSAWLDAGEGAIPLLFFGKILHDRGVDGPYELRFVMLFERAGADDIPGDTVDPAYTTGPYRASSFSDAPYVTPAPTFEVVDRDSPSQRDRPPPLHADGERPIPRTPPSRGSR